MGRLVGGIFSLFVVAAVAAVAGVLWFEREAARPGPLGEPAIVIVPSGVGVSGVAHELARHGVIEEPARLVWRARWRGQAHRLKAGEYVFPPGASLDEALDMLAAGDTAVHAVTVPEGLTSLEVVAILNASDVLAGEIAETPPQGALLPETYHVERGETRRAVLDRMAAAMDSTLAELWAGRAEGLPLASPEEAVILASIVEKETGLAEERRRIAGVFVNRLGRGMRLQSDPTVIFALTRGEAPLSRDLLRSDWRYDDPYNTYVHAGLPPGPIANPGRDAIAAALDPLDTDELYFVADGAGGHAFAETLAEHNRNVLAYRARRDPD